MNSRKKLWLHTLLMVVLMSSGWLLPFGGTLTEYGVRVMMIFVGAIWGWIFIGLVIPSFSALIFLVLAGTGTAKEVIGSGFGAGNCCDISAKTWCCAVTRALNCAIYSERLYFYAKDRVIGPIAG